MVHADSIHIGDEQARELADEFGPDPNEVHAFPDRVDPLEIVESASIYTLTEGAIILDTIFEECTDPETGEIDVPLGYFEQRVKIGDLTDDKIEKICQVVQNHRAMETRIAEAVAELTEVLDSIPQVKSLREEIDRLETRKRTMENNTAKTKELLMWYLVTTGKKSVETGTFRVWRQRSGQPKVDAEMAELEKWPLCYLTLKADKRAVAKAWKKEQKRLGRCLNCGAVDELHGNIFAAESRWVCVTETCGEETTQRVFHCCSDQEVWEELEGDALEQKTDDADIFFCQSEQDKLNEFTSEGITWGRGEIYVDPPDIPDDVVITEGEHIRIK